MLIQPERGTAVDNLLSEPHKTNEGAQRASDHKTTLETVGEKVLSARKEVLCI